MKIGILTFHRADNYGALLQVYALQQKLVLMGNEVQVVDYRCKPIEDDYVYHIFPRLRKNIIRWILELLRNVYIVRKKKEKASKCRDFRDKYLNLSKSVIDEIDRENIRKEFDLIVTGSDQIWNAKLTFGKDDWYCFSQENTNKLLVSYAASVGNVNLFDSYFTDYIKDLQKYTYISVREDDAKKYIENKINRQVYKVCDPTLLIKKEMWFTLIDSLNKRNEKKYLLYYDVELNEEAKRIALALSRRYNLKLVHFNNSIRMIFEGKYMQNAGPVDFLWLIKNAEIIVTSSFHATLFSVMFNKTLISVPHPFTGSRVRSLLSDFKLNGNICENYEDLKEIDFYKIEKDSLKNYQNIIEESEGFLKMCLSGEV